MASVTRRADAICSHPNKEESKAMDINEYTPRVGDKFTARNFPDGREITSISPQIIAGSEYGERAFAGNLEDFRGCYADGFELVYASTYTAPVVFDFELWVPQAGERFALRNQRDHRIIGQVEDGIITVNAGPSAGWMFEGNLSKFREMYRSDFAELIPPITGAFVTEPEPWAPPVPKPISTLEELLAAFDNGLPSSDILEEAKLFVIAQVGEAAKVESLVASVQRLQAVESRGYAAVEIIADALIEEAVDRGWCSDYDAFVDRLNDRLPAGYNLRVRSKDYTVRLSFTVTVEMTVNSCDEDNAIEAAKESFGRGLESSYGWSAPDGSIYDVSYDGDSNASADED